jgi:hypothetical protein
MLSAVRLIAAPFVALALVLLHAPPVAAADDDADQSNLFAADPFNVSAPIFDAHPLGILGVQTPSALAPSRVASPISVERQAKAPVAAPGGSGLPAALSMSFVALQVLDVHSTLRAIDRGARESNGLMAPFVDQPAAFMAVKAGTAAAILYMSDRVSRRSRVGAIVMMAAFTSAYATVVTNNYRIAARLGP